MLEESSASLNEVVVVGYGTQKKLNLTGAVTTASGEIMKTALSLILLRVCREWFPI